MSTQLITVPFHGNRLYVLPHNDEPYTPMKPVVEGMGLDWKAQYTKLKSNSRFSMVEITIQVPGDNQRRATTCLPLRKLPGWLMGIHPNKVRSEIRDKVIMYQNECDDALWDYWTKGMAVRSTITTAQAGELFTLICERFPDGGDRHYAWTRFNSHFRISTYKDLPSRLFGEACEYIKTIPAKYRKTEQYRSPSPRRWIVSETMSGKDEWIEISHDACVFPYRDIPKIISEPGASLPSSVIADIARACISRLEHRASK